MLLDYIDRQCAGAGTPVLVAHNGRRFDVPFLSNELKRSNLELPPHCAYFDTLVFCKVRSVGTPAITGNVGDTSFDLSGTADQPGPDPDPGPQACG